jgi:hypothetical protein
MSVDFMEAKIAEVCDLNCNALKAVYEDFFFQFQIMDSY